MMLDIALGMHTMHSHKPPIIHRDLKSLNLLLLDPLTGPTDRVKVKVTDFGLSRFLEKESIDEAFQDDSQLMTG